MGRGKFSGPKVNPLKIKKKWNRINLNLILITVEYKKGEDPQLLKTGRYELGSSPSLIALSPNAEVVVVATTNSLAFYSALSGDLDYKIENIYNGE